MPFTLPPLPYPYESLEPYIDEKTMRIHHTKHHQTYITKLNQALEKAPEFQNKSLEWLLVHLSQVPTEIRTAVKNNGGGHFAHSMFWKVLKPQGSGEPTGKLKTAIDSTFGNFSTFKEKFTELATGHFASGWAWLYLDKEKRLTMSTTHDHDCPLTQDLTPIFVVDLWEHAYYLAYQNERPKYLAALWNVYNWDEVNNKL